MDPWVEDSQNVGPQRFAMRLSLGVGFFMLVSKIAAYWITGSVAILSDAAESVVHIVAVSFAAYSLWLSLKPPDRSHLYGHDKISFFSAGFEGAMIVMAAFYIIYVSVEKWIAGLKLEHLGLGTGLIVLASLINGGLGFFLIAMGRKHRSLILEANGRHVLTDCWTSIGVVVGLTLAMFTGWLEFDPLIAILVALNILWSGGHLIRRSIGGLMDEVDPAVEVQLKRHLDTLTGQLGLQYHGLRHRSTGNTLWVEFHLLFPVNTSLASAHALATRIEEELEQQSPGRTEVLTHLETVDDHQEIHSHSHFERLPEA
jgi:cation diffusion facilitator family transporter